MTLSDYPHLCDCGAPCYRGAMSLECTNQSCRHFKDDRHAHVDRATSLAALYSADTNLLEGAGPAIFEMPAPNHEERRPRHKELVTEEPGGKEAIYRVGDLRIAFQDMKVLCDGWCLNGTRAVVHTRVGSLTHCIVDWHGHSFLISASARAHDGLVWGDEVYIKRVEGWWTVFPAPASEAWPREKTREY